MSEQSVEIVQPKKLITTARDLNSYCYDLDITKDLLATGKVLNIGCGGSNIENMLKVNKGIVNIDIQHDPYFNIMNTPIRSLAAKIAEKVVPNNVSLKRKLAGTEGRTIAQADMLKLPFTENQFDFVLAYWSTYQLPIEKRIEAFKEIIRVGKRIHITPIFGVDFEVLMSMREELDFTIVSSAPLPTLVDGDTLFAHIKSIDDYGKYVKENPTERLYVPNRQDVGYKPNSRIADASGGNTIVLCKNSYL